MPACPICGEEVGELFELHFEESHLGTPETQRAQQATLRWKLKKALTSLWDIVKTPNKGEF